jgi:hypothetical protein
MKMADELKTFPHVRPPKLRNPEEPEIVPDLDALQKEFDDRRRTTPPTTPTDVEGLLVMPEGHYDELNRQIDEWHKYLDNLPQGDDEENSNGNS